MISCFVSFWAHSRVFFWQDCGLDSGWTSPLLILVFRANQFPVCRLKWLQLSLEHNTALAMLHCCYGRSTWWCSLLALCQTRLLELRSTSSAFLSSGHEDFSIVGERHISFVRKVSHHPTCTNKPEMVICRVTSCRLFEAFLSSYQLWRVILVFAVSLRCHSCFNGVQPWPFFLSLSYWYFSAIRSLSFFCNSLWLLAPTIQADTTAKADFNLIWMRITETDDRCVAFTCRPHSECDWSTLTTVRGPVMTYAITESIILF